MECDYTRLNHNLLVSPKKKVPQGRDYKGGDYKGGLHYSYQICEIF
jgi:hypothetical protein